MGGASTRLPCHSTRELAVYVGTRNSHAPNNKPKVKHSLPWVTFPSGEMGDFGNVMEGEMLWKWGRFWGGMNWGNIFAIYRLTKIS